jgi:hypothetical protein
MPPVKIPVHEDFFKASLSPTDCVPVLPALYQSLTGSLVQVLKTRDEIRPFVSHLCSKNSCPLEGDYAKAIHILRYLHSTPDLGRVYKSNSLELFAHADAAFALHDNGCSAGAFFLSLGATNAPFHTEAKSQDDVATCPMTSEYYSAGAACQSILHYRQLLTDFGCPPRGPTTLFLDCNTAISLVTAPEVSRKSKHITVKHHYIRQLYERRIVFPTHTPSAHLRADVLTKYFPPSRFILHRDILLNVHALRQ